MSILSLCHKIGRTTINAWKRIVISLHHTFHVHDYEPITSIYYKENDTIRYHVTVRECKICGHRETTKKEIVKKNQLYQICCNSSSDSNLNCLMVGTTIDDVKTRVITYLERINNVQLMPFVGITPVDFVDGLKINVGEGIKL